MSILLTPSIPTEVIEIIKTLNSKGFEAYIVGGCVRDTLMQIPPKDWDIATSALPETVKKLFAKTIDTGLKHGTVTIAINNSYYEVTTFRIDGQYNDNRHPDSVSYTNSIIEDLSRRDFTINAIAYHPDSHYIDPFDGIGDISKKIIKTVGDPDKRFTEDALRLLRAIRFSAQLNFTITKEALDSITKNATLIQNISSERIREEITKLLISNAPDKFNLLFKTKLLEYIFPEFIPCYNTQQNSRYHIYTVAQHILVSTANIENIPYLRWTMLLHDIGKPYTKTTDDKNQDHFYGHENKSVQIAWELLNRLKFDSQSIDRITTLIKIHDKTIHAKPESIKKFLRYHSIDIFNDYIKIRKADITAQNPTATTERREQLVRLIEVFQQVIQSNQCFSLKQLAVTGSDLIEIGFKQGTSIGKALDTLLDIVIEKPECNNKEFLLNAAMKLTFPHS